MWNIFNFVSSFSWTSAGKEEWSRNVSLLPEMDDHGTLALSLLVNAPDKNQVITWSHMRNRWFPHCNARSHIVVYMICVPPEITTRPVPVGKWFQWRPLWAPADGSSKWPSCSFWTRYHRQLLRSRVPLLFRSCHVDLIESQTTNLRYWSEFTNLFPDIFLPCLPYIVFPVFRLVKVFSSIYRTRNKAMPEISYASSE